jgi:hypothetical protein
MVSYLGLLAPGFGVLLLGTAGPPLSCSFRRCQEKSVGGSAMSTMYIRSYFESISSGLKFGGKTQFQIWWEISNSKCLKLIFRGGSANRTCKYIFRGGFIKPTTPENVFFEAIALTQLSLQNHFQRWLQCSNRH